MNNLNRLVRFSSIIALLCALGGVSHAAPLIRAGSGMDSGDIQSLLDLFVLDLDSAHTSIDWDEIEDENASPNTLPGDYYQTTDPRGIVLSTPGSGFQVSADADNPTSTPTLFGNIDPSFEGVFQAFSAERLLTPIDSTEVNITFSHNSGQPASVNGFGAVFSGVDSIDSTYIEFFDENDNSLSTIFVPAGPSGGLSFLGVSFDPGVNVGSVLIKSGNTPLASGVSEGPGIDLVAIDNLVFSNPVPEPSTFALVALSLAGLVAARSRR